MYKEHLGMGRNDAPALVGHAGDTPGVAWSKRRHAGVSGGAQGHPCRAEQPHKKKVTKMCMGAVFETHLKVPSEVR